MDSTSGGREDRRIGRAWGIY